MHTSFTKEDKRTHYALELSAANIGERVSVLGWAQRQRDLGSLIFIDLRDRTGIVQLAFDDSCSEEIFNAAFGVRAEYVIAARGTVRRRGQSEPSHGRDRDRGRCLQGAFLRRDPAFCDR